MDLLDAKIRRNLGALLYSNAAEYPDPERVMELVEELEQGARVIEDWPPGNVWISHVDEDCPVLHNFASVRDAEREASIWARTQCGEEIHWGGVARGVRLRRAQAAAFARACARCHDL